MRKAFGGALCAALIGGLALAAISGGATARTSVTILEGPDARVAAQRATATYKGELKQAGPNTSFKVKAKIKNGKPKAITDVIYRGLPAFCPVSVPNQQRISGSWGFVGGVPVNRKRKFKVAGDNGEPMPSSLRLTGRFSRNFNKVRGKFQTTVYFPEGPEETCVGQTKPYAAKR